MCGDVVRALRVNLNTPQHTILPPWRCCLRLGTVPEHSPPACMWHHFLFEGGLRECLLFVSLVASLVLRGARRSASAAGQQGNMIGAWLAGLVVAHKAFVALLGRRLVLQCGLASLLCCKVVGPGAFSNSHTHQAVWGHGVCFLLCACTSCSECAGGVCAVLPATTVRPLLGFGGCGWCALGLVSVPVSGVCSCLWCCYI